MQSGGSSQKTLKKENGAAFTTPVRPTLVTQAIGRGSTKEVSTLERSRGERSAEAYSMGGSWLGRACRRLIDHEGRPKNRTSRQIHRFIHKKRSIRNIDRCIRDNRVEKAIRGEADMNGR